MLKTICSYCGTTSYKQGKGNGCHACGKGIMMEDVKEHQRGYFGYASGRMAIQNAAGRERRKEKNEN